MTDSSQTQVGYIEESAYGTTPATPAFQKTRYTGESLNANRRTTRSNEISADRNLKDVVQVGSEAGGGIEFELSYGSFDDFLESVMFNAWATNVLKNGNTQKSFTFEKKFTPDAGDQYHRFTGQVADTMSLAIAAGEIVTGSFGFLGKGSSTDQAIIAGATYVEPNTNDVINAATNFASLSMTGVTSPEITELNLNITNNLRQQPVVGSVDSRGIGTGRFEVGGTLLAYFENEEMYDLFLAGTATDLSFQLGGASSKKYQFDLDKIKFESGEIVAGGNDQEVLASMAFVGLYEGNDNTLKITRTP